MIDLARAWRHLIADRGSVRRLLSDADMEAIGRAIAAGETRHDGEVRFCVEAGLPWSYLRRNARARERAVMLFSKLRVWDTERNTGVLIYLLVADRAIEIVADRGIAHRVPQAEWDAICTTLGRALARGRSLDGVQAALAAVHALLERHFPPQARNDNELPDAPVVL